MRHEQLVFFSGSFRGGAQLRWPIADKEAFAIVSWRKRGEWMLYEGVTIFRDHHSLAYIFSSTMLVAELSKTPAQRLVHWRTYLG